MKKNTASRELVSTKSENQVDVYYGDTFDVINNKFETISGMLPYNPKLQEKVTNQIAGEMIVANAKRNYDFSRIDLDADVEKFIKSQNSESTQKSYLKSINDFQDFCLRENYDFVRVTIEECREYLEELNSEVAPRTARVKIAGVKSFFDALLLQYDVIKVNPFYKLKLPKIVDKFELDYPTEKDVKVLKEELKRIGRNDLICLVDLLYKYGWKIGLLNKIDINKNGSFCGESKGRIVKGKLTKVEMKRIFDNGILNLKSAVMSTSIVRITSRLFRDGKVSCNFSCHDLRRARITIDVNSCNNISELMKVSKKYHKDLSTTMLYLRDYSVLKHG